MSRSLASPKSASGLPRNFQDPGSNILEHIDMEPGNKDLDPGNESWILDISREAGGRLRGGQRRTYWEVWES